MSRILWVTDEPPDRSRGGGSIRQANLLQRVAAAHEVHLVTTNAVDDTRAVADVASTTLVGAPPPAPPTTTARRAVDLARAAVTGGPAGLRATQGLRELMLPSVLRLAADVDLVCVEHDWLAPLGLHVRHVPTSLTLHYLPSQRADQWSQSAPSALRRLRWAEEARRLRRLEADWVAGYDGVVVVSGPAEFHDPPQTEAMQRLRRLWGSPVARTGMRFGLGIRLVHPAQWQQPDHPHELAARVGAPVLVVHGRDDHFFPPEDAERLAAAAGGTLWLEPAGFGHAEDGLTVAFCERLAVAVTAGLVTGRFPERQDVA